MAIALVASTIKAPGNNGGTTDAIDTTGATLLVLVASVYRPLATSPLPSDSKGNTWTARTSYDSGSNDPRVKIYYAQNPVVGSGHTVTLSDTNSFPVLTLLAFSGTATASVYDTENGANSGASPVTSLASGSVSPSQDGEVIVTGITWNSDGGTSPSIDNGFTVTQSLTSISGTRMGGGAGYKIQTTAASVNPGWSWTGAVQAAVNAATFKAAAAASRKQLAALGVG
jgi:hypothetical protein